MDTFDYKPTLAKMAGKPMPVLPGVSGQIEALLKSPENRALPSPFEFAPFGHSGRYVNNLFEQFGPCMDDIAFLYGVKVDSNSHGASTMHVNTGSVPERFWRSLRSPVRLRLESGGSRLRNQ